MTEIETKTALYDMLYLTSCGIAETVPDKARIGKMNLANVYAVSKFHFLNAVTCVTLESAGYTSGGLMKDWIDSKNKAARKNLLLDADRQKIMTYMENNGIRYMPLKGVILKEFYPKSYMRQMSDNDILFDENYRKNICDWFKKNGYTVTLYNNGNHDTYQKEPVYNYEMHVSLYSPSHKTAFYDYYSDVWDRLILKNGSECCYLFADNDFYIYVITHIFKHYDVSGTGLRSLLDVYVMLKTKTLDFEYIERETERLEIYDFEKRCRKLCQKVFENPNTFNADELSESEREMLEFFLSSGTYGTFKNTVNKRMKEIEAKTGKRSKWLYYKSRIFPDNDTLKASFPFFYEHKWLLPVLWFYRCFRALTVSREKIVGEIKCVRKYKE